MIVSSEDVANAEAVLETVLRLLELGLAFVAPKPSRELGRRAAVTAVKAAERSAVQVKGALGGALGPLGFFCAIGVAPGLAGLAKSVRVKRAKLAKAQLQAVQDEERSAGGSP